MPLGADRGGPEQATGLVSGPPVSRSSRLPRAQARAG